MHLSEKKYNIYIYVYIHNQFYSQNHYKLTTIFRLKIAIS